MARRVVVSGIGVVSPVGIGIEATFDALVAGRSGIRAIQSFDASTFDSPVGGEVAKYAMADYVPKSYRKATKVMARDIELATVAAYLAVKDAGLRTKCVVERGEAPAPVDVDSTRFGANIGAGLICADLVELSGALATAAENRDAAPLERRFSFTRWGSEGMTNLTPLWLLKFLPNMLACHVTIVHDCQAPSNTITCGEASSHLAIGEAYRTIERGAADLCICGGAEDKVNPMSLMRHVLNDRLVKGRGVDPETACRPFDRDRCGSVASQGAGLLILEELERAKSRGARIYAEVVGFGSSCSVQAWDHPQPDGRAQRLALEKAIRQARLQTDDVQCVAPQGFGTVEHDAAEAAAIHGALGSKGREVFVLANKGALGNNGAGSGAIDIAIALEAVRRGVLPPSRNTVQVDPACDLNVVRGDPRDARVDVVASMAHAQFGGQAAALVFKRYAE